MLFIFGWGRTTTTNHGPVMPVTCPNCQNQRYWNLYHQRIWFTLFFIPVIPYENKKLLLCPVCERGLKLTDAQYDRAIALKPGTQRFIAQQMSQEEYGNMVNHYNPLQ